MLTTRDEQYSGLIQALLACQPGEEGRILSEHPNLLDSGLLAAMEAYAKHLSEEGHSGAAQRLRGLAQALQSNGSAGQETGESGLSEEEFQHRAQFVYRLVTAVEKSPGDTTAAHAVDQVPNVV